MPRFLSVAICRRSRNSPAPCAMPAASCAVSRSRAAGSAARSKSNRAARRRDNLELRDQRRRGRRSAAAFVRQGGSREPRQRPALLDGLRRSAWLTTNTTMPGKCRSPALSPASRAACPSPSTKPAARALPVSAQLRVDANGIQDFQVESGRDLSIHGVVENGITTARFERAGRDRGAASRSQFVRAAGSDRTPRHETCARGARRGRGAAADERRARPDHRRPALRRSQPGRAAGHAGTRRQRRRVLARIRARPRRTSSPRKGVASTQRRAAASSSPPTPNISPRCCAASSCRAEWPTETLHAAGELSWPADLHGRSDAGARRTVRPRDSGARQQSPARRQCHARRRPDRARERAGHGTRGRPVVPRQRPRGAAGARIRPDASTTSRSRLPPAPCPRRRVRAWRAPGPHCAARWRAVAGPKRPKRVACNGTAPGTRSTKWGHS